MLKKYYIFFKMGSEYDNKFAIVYAPNISKARETALLKFGVWAVGTITGQEEYALNKIKACGYSPVDA